MEVAERKVIRIWMTMIFLLWLFWKKAVGIEEEVQRKQAYVAMMYMGTPRDYEFYVATRVMLKSLKMFRVDADRVVIASVDVPVRWIQTLEEDDVKVVKVENLNNPYKTQGNFDRRFLLSLNKIYAWSLVRYDRVVMLDSDNLFLSNTDELFYCGQFCAVFINPCVFHTGLFVLQPSTEVFNNMRHELDIGRENPDGADQGFIGGYFSDLLDQPMFHPPPRGNVTKLDGNYRLPLGYQMDASYYCVSSFFITSFIFSFLLCSFFTMDSDLKLRWSVPCGPNSVITFPGASLLKPWYWWSWPVLPLGLLWHERRHHTIGYEAEVPVATMVVVMYLVVLALTKVAGQGFSRLCYHQNNPWEKKGVQFENIGVRAIALWSLLSSYIVPFFLVPRTIHPFGGWGLYFLGVFSLSSVAINALLLPRIPVLLPSFAMFGSLLVMAFPSYPDGVVRALFVLLYACLATPFVYLSLLKVVSSYPDRDRDSSSARPAEGISSFGFNKLC